MQTWRKETHLIALRLTLGNTGWHPRYELRHRILLSDLTRYKITAQRPVTSKVFALCQQTVGFGQI